MRHHLVVLHEQYFFSLLAGGKRIECRLSAVRKPPFEAVARGDLLWFKPPSQPVRAAASVGKCLFRELKRAGDLARLIEPHAAEICAAEGFFSNADRWARFASLFWIERVMAISPMPVRKSDQRAWVVLDGPPRPGMRVPADYSPSLTAAPQATRARPARAWP